jgi:3-hydroxyisobutyrate dehydrogenase
MSTIWPDDAGANPSSAVPGEMLALGKALGVAPADVSTLLEHFNPGAALPARFKRATEARFDEPSWELTMAREDARLMLDEAARASLPLAVLPATAARMDQVIAEGHGGADWTVIAKDALR